jgi:phage baseplate assembly protein W
LDAHPVRKDIFVLTDADAVKTSIRNILFTDRFERFFNPLFGSNIKRTLFENMTASTEMDVRMFVTTAIRNFEPRVDYLEVYVNAIPDENGYYLKVIFSIINNPQLETLNLILNRVR